MLVVKADCEVLESNIRHGVVLISPRSLGTQLHVAVTIRYLLVFVFLGPSVEKKNKITQASN